MSIRVLVADDHRAMREGLCALLEREEDIEVVGQADNGQEAVRLARELSPHVVVLDIAMPDLNGIEAAREIVEAVPSARVVALSMHPGARFVSEMLRAGASGYVLKSSAFEEVVRAIRALVGGQAYLSPGVTGVMVERYVRGAAGPEGPAHGALTPRERQVLQLVAEGLATKQIAARLGLSQRTIDMHRTRIMDKLGLRSIAELTKYAIREGLTSLES